MKKGTMFAVAAIVVVALVISAGVFVSYNGNKSNDNTVTNPSSQTIIDMTGRNVTVPWNITKIVAVGAGALRFVTYLNASSMVIGVEEVEKKTGTNDTGGKTYILAHPEYANLTNIGPQHKGDAELILAAHPDVIFKTSYQSGDCDALQTQIGIPVIGLINQDIGPNLPKFYQQVETIGKVLHKESRATYLENSLKSIFSDLENRTKNVVSTDKPSVYVGGLAYSGSHGMDFTSAYYQPFTLNNASNVITPSMMGNSTSVAQISIEVLPTLNPDVVFVDWSGYQLCKLDYAHNPALYNQIDAFKNRTIYSMLPYNWYATNFDTVLVDAYYVGKILYPTQFADVDMRQKADQIYTAWVGAPCYDKLVVNYGAGLQNISLS